MAVWDSAEQAAASPFPHRDEPLVKFPIALRAVMGALLLLAASGGAVSAATTTVECGLFHDYVAPDPVAVTTGSISFGLSGPTETIAADATLVPPANTNLPGLAGGPPTCLTVDRDAGTITSLAFAASGSISGFVELVPDLFGPGSDGYTIADRLFAPTQIVADNAGLNAIIATAADSGAPLTLTFTIDINTGNASAIDANITLSGQVELQSNGDVLIGAARLLDAVIDAEARDALTEAAAIGVPATVIVAGHGTIDGGSPGGVDMAITLSVSFTAPAATPTASPQPAATPTQATLPDTAFVEPKRSPTTVALVLAGIALLAMLAGIMWLGRTRMNGS